MDDIVLSVLIISHNQKKQLQRCVESVLSQSIPFNYEIIISDDASTDGSWDLICNYVKINHAIKGYQVNSDMINPSMTNERASFNRYNAYIHSKGMYISHIDGDDYYTSNDILKYMVSMLESHPKCSVCFQNYVVKQDNIYDTSSEELAFPQEIFIPEREISQDDFITKFPYLHNSACCMRRNPDIHFKDIFHIYYDDMDITYLHLLYGKVMLINRANFVYVRYNKITASKFNANDQAVCWLSCINNVVLAPQCTGSLMRAGLSDILSVVNLARKKLLLTDNAIKYLSKKDIFIFRFFDNKFRWYNRFRVNAAWVVIHFIRAFKLDCDSFYSVLYRLIVSFRIPKNVKFCRSL